MAATYLILRLILRDVDGERYRQRKRIVCLEHPVPAKPLIHELNPEENWHPRRVRRPNCIQRRFLSRSQNCYLPT
jgi:hypothetical protein